jgi:hypothetical protein
VTAFRRETRAFVELIALCGFAITQPLLDIFGRAVTQFAFRGATGRDVVVFGVLLTFGPALVLWAAEAVVGLVSSTIRRRLHLLFVAVLVAAFVVQVARPLLSGALLLVLALLIAAGAGLLYLRATAARQWLSFAAVAPLGFLGLFVLTSPTGKLVSGAAASSTALIGDPAPVVVLLLDELPLASLIGADGEIDAELYPNLAALVDTSHWFRNTTTLTGATFHAVPSILTGNLPDSTKWPISADHPGNLFTLLGGGMDLNVTETFSRLCPVELCELEQRSTDALRELGGDAAGILRDRLLLKSDDDDPVAGLGEEPSNREEDGIRTDLHISQPTRFNALLDGIEGDDPALHFLHILLPHVPYEYLPSGGRYQGPVPDIGRLADDDMWGPETWPITLARQRHVLQVGYVDRLVGELVDTLRERGVYDEALIVVVADHGISFKADGPIRGMKGQPLDEDAEADILWVPLIIKEPGQSEGVISDANVLTIDVLPTVADILDIDMPWDVDGRSALGEPREGATKPSYSTDVGPFSLTVEERPRLDAAEGWQRVLARSVDSLLPPAGRDRIWRVGPSPALVGQEVSSIEDGLLEPIDVVLHGPEAFEDLDPKEDFLPVLVRGRIDGIERGTPLAVAVNGVVGATGPVFRDEDGLAFAVMISEELLEPGRNRVEVYRIDA